MYISMSHNAAISSKVLSRMWRFRGPCLITTQQSMDNQSQPTNSQCQILCVSSRVQSRAEKRRVAVWVPTLWLGQQLSYERLSHWDCGSLRKGQFIVAVLLFIVVKIMLLFISQTPYTPYRISEGPCVGRGWRTQLNWCFQPKQKQLGFNIQLTSYPTLAIKS